MVGVALVKALHALPTWTRTVALVDDHAALRTVLGCTPSLDACYRFTTKLRRHSDSLAQCIDAVLGSLADENPAMGEQVAIDGSDLPAYANGQRFLYNHGPERKTYSDPDASWGHRSAVSSRKGRGFDGYDKTQVIPLVASRWVKADRLHPLVPRRTDRWKALYRQRGCVERLGALLQRHDGRRGRWNNLPGGCAPAPSSSAVSFADRFAEPS